MNNEEIEYTNQGNYIYEYEDMGTDEYFDNELYLYDFMPYKSHSVLRYIDSEDVYRYDEFNSSHKGMQYNIDRDSKHLSLHAIITTGLFTDDISVEILERLLGDLSSKSGFKFNVVALDEIYVTVFYHKVNTVKMSRYQQLKNTVSLYNTEKYNTLSKMNLDIIDVINVIEDYANLKNKE